MFHRINVINVIVINYFFEEKIHFSDLTHVVLDEVDTLFDESFQETVLNILKSVKVLTLVYFILF